MHTISTVIAASVDNVAYGRDSRSILQGPSER
jgi:hypothetical protein